MPKKTIGRREKVDFPELQLSEVDAKIDTGAYTSSIHCHHIEKIDHDGQVYVYFDILDPNHPHYQDIQFKLPILAERPVKSSSGESENRIFIKTSVCLFDEQYDIELSLTNRSQMKYPVLLGRKAIEGRYMVDVSKVNVSYKTKNKQ